jgi:hypothetical protein
MATLPLFQRLARGPIQRVPVVVDANIFFDLDDENPGKEESQSLGADWFGEFVELSVTQELLNEINRRDDPAVRRRQRARATLFPQVPRDLANEEGIHARVKELLSTKDTPSSQSDARQIAMTIAANVRFFVTRDEAVLGAAELLDDEFGLAVMSPHEVIRRFDALSREDAYRPRRLFFGNGANSNLARADELEQIADLLHVGQPGPEPRRRTKSRLREILADPQRYETTCIRLDGALVATYALDRNDPGLLAVPFFEVAASALGPTAARHYGEFLVTVANRERRHVVRVETPSTRVADALADLGFSKHGDAWMKLTLPILLPPDAFASELESIGASHSAAAALAQRLALDLRTALRGSSLATAQAVELERALWPAKMTGTDVPCFVVPIQPRWAKELFDQQLAQRTLFGAKPSLALNSENVYYRSARPEVLKAPARVLWYVSDDPAYPQSKAIRACSYIDELVVDLPKELFRRFKRLGVYEWKDVYGVAKEDVCQEIMAFRFSKTELFGKPVAWLAMQEVFKTHTGKPSQLQSPLRISEACFFDLYMRGVRIDGA